jgi:hypothetical protein
MDTDIVVSKRKRGRPRKVQPPPPVITENEVEEIIEIEEIKTPPAKEPEKEKKTRKQNPWIELCKEVQKRPENAGKSYREVMKLAKLEYK